MKIAFLIPSTTRKRPWRKMEETYLYKIFGQSFIHTTSDDIEYTIYINIDADDSLDIFATVENSNGLRGNIEWSKSNDEQEEESDNSYMKGNVKFKEGLNKIYIIESGEVKVNTLY